ncbi:hypothetical protein [Robiginitalea sp. SC105]|uniref:hypothetical protein n=1 Tax=Robiginitalea sp. SC105 TaxID=2762332 RepID=UPI00163B3B75|nr:hypothetical protein [Robiginitalea sp. SC105]MBC2839297.1 hypothetical protein [Robiginitalea sp. SC105]
MSKFKLQGSFAEKGKMYLIAILVFLMLLLVGLLLLPLEVYLNTGTNEYWARWRGLVRVRVEGDPENILRIRLQAFFRNFYFYPLKARPTHKPADTEKKKQKRKSSRKRPGFRKIIRILRTFRVRELTLYLDTGNFPLNAKLYPAFALLNGRLGNFNCNFEGRNQLVVHLENRPLRLLKSFINN